MFSKNVIITTIVVVIVITTMYGSWYYYHVKYIHGSEHQCQFCDKPAVMVRKPVPHKIEERKLFDIEPGFAELQTVYTCEECKVIAGGFRTTVWHPLK